MNRKNSIGTCQGVAYKQLIFIESILYIMFSKLSYFLDVTINILNSLEYLTKYETIRIGKPFSNFHYRFINSIIEL